MNIDRYLVVWFVKGVYSCYSMDILADSTVEAEKIWRSILSHDTHREYDLSDIESLEIRPHPLYF